MRALASGSGGEPPPARGKRPLFAAGVFLAVLAVQLLFVAKIGTDVPFHDQWNVEGQWLYPTWQGGDFGVRDLLAPVNEHRIVWTHLLNLALFELNGQWDPLVQLAAIALLRAGCAAGAAWLFVGAASRMARFAAAAVTAVAFLPHLAWHAVLWGFESQVYFALGFSLLALLALSGTPRSCARLGVGMAAGLAALLAMGPGALVPVALLGIVALRSIERQQLSGATLRDLAPALALLACFLWLRPEAPQHETLQAASVGQFFTAAGRVLGWPHGAGGSTAFVMNAPLLLAIGGRLLRRRAGRTGEDAALAVGLWSAAVGLATAWARGGSAELAAGVPSRYVDFLVLLPLANVWCAMLLVGEVVRRWRAATAALAMAWSLFVAIGWVGLSAETMRGLVLPRLRDPAAPVRLAREFQLTGSAAVFTGQPRLYVPHPNLDVVAAVLGDPRLEGALPPSFQPEQRPGPLSRGVRQLFAHDTDP